ncbi:contractile injection system tape measure protein [Glaciecola sp. 1036]|uniref:contractile injection system tape measure protein n=1 Tax=Alteromonadaceae TaxID=72275 RepID=UPI003D04DD5A
MDSNLHRVKRLRFNASVNSTNNGFALRQLLQSSVPELESVLSHTLDQEMPVQDWLFIPSLHLDIDLADTQMQDREAILDAIQKALLSQIEGVKNAVRSTSNLASGEFSEILTNQNGKADRNASTKKPKAFSNQDNLIDVLFYYLSEGILPWYRQTDNDIERQWKGLFKNQQTVKNCNQKIHLQSMRERWIHLLITHTEDFELLTVILNSELINQETAKLLIRFFEQHTQSTTHSDIISLLLVFTAPKLTTLDKRSLDQAERAISVLFKNVQGVSAKSELQQIQKRLLNAISSLDANSLPDSIARSQILDTPQVSVETNQPRSHEEQAGAEIISIPFAGLILLHPYMSRLFSGQGWLDDQKQLKASAINTAAKALCYLSTGNASLPDYQSGTIKLLLGLPLATFLPLNEEPLEQKVIHDLDNLLSSFITHWGKIGNISHQGLRAGFMHRQGLLQHTEEYWQLSIDRKAHDVLLDFLPFSISTVKLPWMPLPIHLTW